MWDSSCDLLFWVLFGICAYWFLFFKGQDNVHILAPAAHDVHVFVTILIVTFVGKFIRLIDVLWRQTHSDVFIIDWEKSRGRLMSRPGKRFFDYHTHSNENKVDYKRISPFR